MKTTVILDELSLSEVRPDPIALQYSQLRRDEALGLLSDTSVRWQGRPMPVQNCDPVSVFERDGLSYHRCEATGSLFASPVPCQDALDELARSGAATRLRRDYFAQRFSENQREAIHAPLVRWMGDALDEHGVNGPIAVAMVGNDNTGTALALQDKLAPSRFATVARISGQPVPNADVYTAEDAPKEAFDLIVDCGSLDRVADPLARVQLWWDLLAPGGFLAFTTNTANGLEYQLLGGDAPSFVALDRLTLFTIPAMQSILTDQGFDVEEMSTPGRLDVELMENVLADYKGDDLHFWQFLFKHGSESMKADLQTFLQRHKLSSFARVFARKPR